MRAAAAFFTFRTLRAIYGESMSDANYHNMRDAYHAWQRAVWHDANKEDNR